MTEVYLLGGPAYRIIEVNGDLGFAVEVLKPGDSEPVQLAAFKSHAEAQVWIVNEALKASHV